MKVDWNAEGRLVIAGIDVETAHELVRTIDKAERWVWIDGRVTDLRNLLADRLMRGERGKAEGKAEGEAEEEGTSRR